MLRSASKEGYMQEQAGAPWFAKPHLIAVVGVLLIGCASLLMVGCAGGRSEAPEEQGHTEATEREARSPQSTTEEARCDGTRTIKPADFEGAVVTTNDLPGCPKGGLLLGTNEDDNSDGLYGGEGDDEIHGLGGVDLIMGGDGNDVIYGGPGDDSPLMGIKGDDVIYGGDGNDALGEQDLGEDIFYGGDGNDYLFAIRDKQQPDKLYCGEGRDDYFANKNDYVHSSCEIKDRVGPGMP
jgi:RTX calcium-binding nonapeptide repeat (4 copies)